MDSNTPAIVPPAAVTNGYIERAYKGLATLGVLPAKAEESSAVMTLIADVSSIDEARALILARTLQAEGVFNALVRDEIKGTNVGETYLKIAKNFDSIITDAKALLDQANAGHALGFRERASNFYMKMSRGSLHDRFMKIRAEFQDVSTRTGDALAREERILAAYMDFRGALKEAETAAYVMLEKQTKVLADAQSVFRARTDEVAAAAEGQAKATAQLARDEAKIKFDIAQRRTDRIKKIADNLKIGYNVGEAIVGRLSQGHEVKQGIYDTSVTFFSTNESSFTTIDATLTQTAGLHETTEATKSLERGMERSIEAIADVGGAVMESALRTSHGITVSADSVKKLIDSVVAFQARSFEIAKEERVKATENALLMEKYVDEGKQRFAALVDSQGAK